MHESRAAVNGGSLRERAQVMESGEESFQCAAALLKGNCARRWREPCPSSAAGGASGNSAACRKAAEKTQGAVHMTKE